MEHLDNSEEALLAQRSMREAMELVLGGGANVQGKDSLTEEFTGDECVSRMESLVANRPSTTLELAIQDYDAKKVMKLIRQGADVNELGREGLTPLMMAISTGQFALVKMLIEDGADPNTLSEDGSSALSMAIVADGDKIVQYLLAHGAEVNLANYNEETPLMEALYCENPSHKIISILLDAGASVLRKSIMGDSPLSLVERSGNPGLIHFFSEKTSYALWSDVRLEKAIRSKLRSWMKGQMPS